MLLITIIYNNKSSFYLYLYFIIHTRTRIPITDFAKTAVPNAYNKQTYLSSELTTFEYKLKRKKKKKSLSWLLAIRL